MLYWIEFISGDFSDEKRFTELDTQTDMNKFHQNIVNISRKQFGFVSFFSWFVGLGFFDNLMKVLRKKPTEERRWHRGKIGGVGGQKKSGISKNNYVSKNYFLVLDLGYRFCLKANASTELNRHSFCL